MGGFYKDAKEYIIIDEPAPRVKEVGIHCFVDASHASDKVTRISQTVIMIFVNKAPITFYSKRQNSVKTFTFGSDFTEMKQSIDLLNVLWYKLRMFSIPIGVPEIVYRDNDAVYKNVAVPSSVISKNMHSISCHFWREAVATGMVRVGKEDAVTNLAVFLTKFLPKARVDFLLD